MIVQRRDQIEAAFSLGTLISEHPVLLREVENLVGNGFRGLELPRGVRVRARALIARIRKGAPQGETKPASVRSAEEEAAIAYTVQACVNANRTCEACGRTHEGECQPPIEVIEVRHWTAERPAAAGTPGPEAA